MIKIDMFEVQLGAAMLLQFTDREGGAVSVLADAGVHASGYPREHVRDKLRAAMGVGEDDPVRIDLIVGTHYDADHLSGLVPVIEDEGITIGEAWMPPVADDTAGAALDSDLGDSDLLAIRFADEESGLASFRSYVEHKRDTLERLRRLEHALDGRRTEESAVVLSEFPSFDPALESVVPVQDAVLAYFRDHRDDAGRTVGDGFTGEHADEPIWTPERERSEESALGPRSSPELEAAIRRSFSDAPDRQPESALESGVAQPNSAANVALFRRATATEAINATALSAVVSALRVRGIPIRVRSIDDGEPRRFVWNSAKRVFVGQGSNTQADIAFSLLGPSKSLIEKHWKRLPIPAVTLEAVLAPIRIKRITPSNQLSYVLHFRAEDQGILVAGDAGCVDFREKRNSPYFPKLLERLDPLDVVQIAHHGGNNAHFYRVLLEAADAEGLKTAFLLLSHATDDKFRPSNEFRLFVEHLRGPGTGPSLLFTSRPKRSKVEDYEELIFPASHPGSPDKGDVTLEFDGAGWAVARHSVAVS